MNAPEREPDCTCPPPIPRPTVDPNCPVHGERMTAPTLPDFLLARYAEDANAAPRHHRLLCMRTACDREGCLWDEGEEDALERERVCTCDYPARILADVEAKRRIVEAYLDERSRRDVYQSDESRAVEDDEQRERRRSSAARCRGLEIAVEALALPYADHPEYREEWKP